MKYGTSITAVKVLKDTRSNLKQVETDLVCKNEELENLKAEMFLMKLKLQIYREQAIDSSIDAWG